LRQISRRAVKNPRDGAIIFGDLIGKLDMLRIDCPKCGRSGRYRLADLLMRYGRNEKKAAKNYRQALRRRDGSSGAASPGRHVYNKERRWPG
jgi:hypothetical protein